jgi:hypothetical protein
MKRVLFLFVLFVTGELAFGQEVLDQRRAETMKDPKFLEFKKRHEDLVKQQPAENKSEYYNYDETLRSLFVDNQIPATTPKSIAAKSREEYVKQLNSWISSNKQYLKPEHKNAFIKE